MANDFYAPSGAPAFNAFGTSATIRAEFTALGAAFDKLPALAGNAFRLVQVNGAASGLQVVSDFTVAQLLAAVNGKFAAGSVALPGIAFAADTDTGWWSPSANVLSASTGGVERVRLGAAGEVNVGYGTGAAGLVTVRNDDPTQGAALVLQNRYSTGTVHKHGIILFDAWRDTALSSFVSAVWSEGTTAAGNYGDLLFGAMANGANNAYPTERLRLSGYTGAVTPGADNTQTLGIAGLRWNVVFAGTSTINTSDAREKTAVAALTAAEIAAAKALPAENGTFRFLDAVAAKGSAARRHAGLTVQRAIAVMTACGLDPMAYGFICHDTWAATATAPAGDRYGFRTDELLMFLARGFDARLAALEAR